MLADDARRDLEGLELYELAETFDNRCCLMVRLECGAGGTADCAANVADMPIKSGSIGKTARLGEDAIGLVSCVAVRDDT